MTKYPNGTPYGYELPELLATDTEARRCFKYLSSKGFTWLDYQQARVMANRTDEVRKRLGAGKERSETT